MRRTLYFGAVLLVIASLFQIRVFAQETTGEIRGKVLDAERGDPLIGANILLTGTLMGSSTNSEGEYVLRSVPPGTYTIQARYVGYRQQTREVTVTASASVEANFQLTVSAVQMSEVVVTGQGAAIEKRKLSATVETISAREISLAPVKSLDQLLQARIPGLSAFSPGGAPGTGARIITRGVKAALSQPTPVIYVDGIRVDNNYQGRLSSGTGGQISSSLADLVTGEIERVEVIKGGAAATLYGSEAANGVIQIFTKKGIPGLSRWNFNVTSGYDAPATRNIWSNYTKEKFFQTGIYQSYRVGVEGGTPNLTYLLSGKISESKGTITQNLLADKLYNLSTGIRAVVSEKTNIEASASYTRTDFGKVYNDNAIASPLSSLEIEGTFEPSRTSNPDSLLRLYLLPELNEVVNRFITSTSLNYTPFSWWTNRLTIGIDYRKNEDRQFASIEAGPIVSQTGGQLFRSDREYMTTTLSLNSTFDLPDFDPVRQRLTVGVQGFRVNDREIRGEGTNFRIPGTKDFDNASTIRAFESNLELFNYGFIAQDQIEINDRIFVDLGLRLDGNSAFGTQVGVQTYPKVGAAYNISDEWFYPEEIKEYVSSLKLRAAWGQTGSFPPPGTRDRQFVAQPYLNESGLNFGNPGNKDLGPERTTSTDYGFDAGLLNDRVSVEFSIYRQVTTNANFSVTEDPAAGLGFQRRNVGKIRNKGIELSIRAAAVDEPDLQVNVRASYATLNNVVKDMGGSAEFTIAGFAFAPMRVRQGSPVGIIRVNKPRLEADGTYRGNSDEVYVGSPTPTRTASLGLDVVLFRDISITALAEGAFGHYILNQSLSRRIVNALNNPAIYQDVLTRIPKVEPGSTPYTRNSASSVLVESGDWIKVREISVRYRVPREFVEGLVVTASVRNPFVLMQKATKVDPETSFIPNTGIELGGIIGATVEPPIQWRFGLDFTL